MKRIILILLVFAFFFCVTSLVYAEDIVYTPEQSSLNNFKNEAGLTGNLRVDNFSGAAVYNLNLDIPGGRNGLQPSLNLYYNSHDRSPDSWTGSGWSLGFGYVVRNTREGTNNLYTGNEFSLFLNGQNRNLVLIDEENDIYGVKLESDYLKIWFDEVNYKWVVTDTLGTKYYFGQTIGSRQDDPDDSDIIYKWLLDKVLDTNDNYYIFTYTKRNGQIYPASINYTGNDETVGPMDIIFNLEERIDISTSTLSHFPIVTDRRLDNIEVKVDDVTKLKYNLDYINGQNASTTLLELVVKKAYQNQTEYTLPTTTLSYLEKSDDWDDATETWDEISQFNRPDGHQPAPLVDFNSDSWVDRGTSFHDGDEWVASGWAFPLNGNGEAFQNVMLGDINGDKFPDIITTYWTGTNDENNYRPRVYINNTENGYYLSDAWTNGLPNIFNSQRPFEFSRTVLVDINGDGLDDLIHAYRQGAGTYYHNIYLNTGTGWSGDYGTFPSILATCDIYGYNCTNYGTQLIDVNGDGLVDVFAPFASGGNARGVYLNNGSGFDESLSDNWVIPVLAEHFGGAWGWGGARLTDINNDGLIDIVVAAQAYYNGANGLDIYELFDTYINTGNSWVNDEDWELPIAIGFNTTDLGTRLMDINDDGLMDVVKALGNAINNDVERAVYLGIGNTANLLAEIDNGYGGTTTIEYQASGKYFNDGVFSNPSLPFNLMTVKETTTADGQGNDITTTYEYQDGEYYYDPLGYNPDYTLNQYAGFGVVTSQTDDKIVKTYYHQGGGEEAYDLGEYEDSIYKIGRVYREEVIQEDGNDYYLLSQKINKWDQEDLDDGQKFIYLDNTISYDYEGDGLLVNNFQMSPPPIGSGGSPNSEYLVDLLAAQLFMPTSSPQLLVELSSTSTQHYFVGVNENGENVYRMDTPSRDEVEGEFGPEEADGSLYVSNQDCGEGDWQDLVDAANGTIDGDEIVDVGNAYFGSTCYLSRIFLPFDTSELPDTATVTSAILGITLSNVQGSAMNMHLVNVDTQSAILESSHFGQFEDTDGAEPIASEVGLLEFVFFPEVLSWISLTGTTTLGIRGDYDFNESIHSPAESYPHIYTSSEENDEEYRPYLSVFYTLNQPPALPSDLEIEGQTNPDDITNQAPEFTAVYNDNNEEDLAVKYQIQVIEAGGNFENPLWDSTDEDLASSTPAGMEIEPVEYGGDNLPFDGMQYFWRIKFWDNSEEENDEGLWSSGLDFFYMDGSSTPTAPTLLLTEGKDEPTNLVNHKPIFSAIYNDDNPLDLAGWYQIQVDDNANFSSPTWDSDKTVLDPPLDNGARSQEIIYGGNDLPYNGTTYYWRIKFWDDEGENGTEGIWSASTTFSMFDIADVLDDVKIRAVKYEYSTSTGNIIGEDNLGLVDAANNGIYVDDTGDEKETSFDYAIPTVQASHIISAPKSKIIVDPINPATTTIELYYDELAHGSVSKANLTKEDLENETSIYEKTFNSFGLVTELEDPLDNTTTIVYESNNYYPTTTTNDLSQVTKTNYDLTCGKPIWIKDANGTVEERDYDAFCRLTEVRKSHPYSTIQLLTVQTYDYYDTVSPTYVKQTNYPTESFEQEIYSYFDGLGRTIQVREESEIAGQFRVSSNKYNDKGNLERQSLPYFDGGSAYEVEGWNNPYTEYTYDVLGRIIEESVITSVNVYTTTYDYDGWNVLITDAEDNQKKLYKDAYSQLIQVDEFLGETASSTMYEYNLLGKITKITDPLGNFREFTYDSLGRLTEQEEMHTDDAENIGVWEYEYDEASNLTSKTDPNGNEVNYTYDDLNRILTEDYTGLAGTEVTYTYDSGDYGLGRLFKVESATTTTKYYYDKWGRVEKETKIIDDNYLTTEWDYSFASLPIKIEYPDNFQVWYTYNNNGLPKTVRYGESDQTIVTSDPLINAVSYSPLKQIGLIDYNNSTTASSTYDVDQAYKLTNKYTENISNDKLQDIDYTYDDVGNITKIEDTSETDLAITIDYIYDNLYRLTNASSTQATTSSDFLRTYTYDIIGNIINKSDIGDYVYGNDNPYQATSINGGAYIYDDNGNLASDTLNIYYYNYNDRLNKVYIDDEDTLTNSYDNNGQRTLKLLTTDTVDTMQNPITFLDATYYPNKVYDENIWELDGDPLSLITTRVRHIYLGNQVIGHTKKVDSGTPKLSLVFSDHLGSSNVLTDSSGYLKTTYDYYPYGEIRNESETGGHSSDYGYTGKELDDETELNYYDQRYYVANLGKFNRQDPVIQQIAMFNNDELVQLTGNNFEEYLSNPQNLNSYSYTTNNPIVYFDPLGLAKVYVRDSGVENSKSADKNEVLGHTMIEVEGIYYGFAPTSDPDSDVQKYNEEDFRNEYENQKWNVVDIGEKYDDAIVAEFEQLKEQGQDAEGGEYKTLLNNCTQKVNEILTKVGAFSKYSLTPQSPHQLLKKFKGIRFTDSFMKIFNKNHDSLVEGMWSETISNNDSSW